MCQAEKTSANERLGWQKGSTPLHSGAENKPVPQVLKPVTSPPCSGLGRQRGRLSTRVLHEGTSNAEIVDGSIPECGRTVQTVKLCKPRQPQGCVWRRRCSGLPWLGRSTATGRRVQGERSCPDTAGLGAGRAQRGGCHPLPHLSPALPQHPGSPCGREETESWNEDVSGKKHDHRNDNKQEKIVPSGADGLPGYMSPRFIFQIIYLLMHWI